MQLDWIWQQIYSVKAALNDFGKDDHPTAILNAIVSPIMEDPNSIAWLFAVTSEGTVVGKRSWEAIRMNKSGYELCMPIERQAESDLRSRETTVSLDDEEDNPQDGTSSPGLHLTFDSELKGGNGLMFGNDPNSCDIVLPKLKHINDRHCSLTFDNQRRLILRDFSRTGTVVTYDGKGGELRRHFTWILGGAGAPKGIKDIGIKIQGISFRIKVSRHDESPQPCNTNVDRFLQKSDELLLGGLGIQSPTAPPSQGPIRLKQETLGMGTFAVVRRFWDVSTGAEYAYKEPCDKREFNWDLWEKEADIMRQISHDHVVKLMEWVFTPSPQLVLEYIPFGSLEGMELSLDESTAVLSQGLSALVDLHGRQVPIVHRDIKPGNILLQSLDPFHIKLTDFGVSKASGDLSTFCGTRCYLAPEVYNKTRYTSAVDIWSLGVVAFECAYGLPNNRTGRYQERDWCELIVDQANDWENGGLIDLLSTAMLIMDPKLRGSAPDCYREASRLTIASYDRCLTPTPTSYAEESKIVAHYPVEGQEIGRGNVQTLSNTQNSFHDGDSTHSSHPSDDRYQRSDALSPSSKSPTITANSSNDAHPVESATGIDLFGGGWLQDPNCVGSSVASMGRESTEWSNWTTDTSGGDIPRSIPEPVEHEQYEDGDPHPAVGDSILPQDAYFINDGVQGQGQLEHVVEGAGTSSEYSAAEPLYTIHQGEGP
ncbi:uncharacterized protein BP5553_07708 [Venustampulla echinocandica]|uniref:non-specific serine/threonine protein kinase n=1 Tax=Venustampulla echinocandica TaxID=2656787 RepID=A0A370THB7_9HELO|nr:uncharacterized protein BP5553_07708 [Venustampulla echinocandica]RDL34580.1 hypothetical protein BP5553_07708 [Venustampulla echinocandica]